MKKIKLYIWILIILVLLSFVAKGWWERQFAPISLEKAEKVITIAKGESFNQIAEELKKENLIRSTWSFKIKAKLENMENKLKPGTFTLSPSQSTDQILKTLTSNPLDIWITLLEGWRVEEMAQKLSQGLGIEQEEFLKYAKEGYMFPDSYSFPKEYSAKQIAQKLKSTFDEKITNSIRDKIKAQGLTEGQGIILASIVEREARTPEVKKVVASILLKRFKIKMGLNADATVQYALGYQKNEKTWWKKELTFDDLKLDSAYNTYIHAGFPPTPICNPGLASIQAVVEADPNTPYLYYFHDSKGNSYYAKTLDEHNENVARYR